MPNNDIEMKLINFKTEFREFAESITERLKQVERELERLDSVEARLDNICEQYIH